MSDLPDRPRLRPVSFKARKLHGEPIFELSDPLRIAEGAFGLAPAGVALASLMDGTRTLAQIRDEFRRRHGFSVGSEVVEGLVRSLDASLLLRGERFLAHVDAWRRDPIRTPACAGGAYPGDAAELRAFLEEHWTRAGGPGAPPGAGARKDPVRAVISPHIDFHRGGHAYAWAWKEVAESCEADLFVIFGTAHAGTERARFALTRKSYATPLGVLETDVELVDRLVAAYDGPDDLFEAELVHRVEHSIEFQAIELVAQFGVAGRTPRPIKALPVLCGGLHDLLGGPGPEPATDPSQDPSVRAFHSALARALAPIDPARVCFVAGVDLAHVGTDFDDPPLAPGALEKILEEDRRTLEVVTARGDPDAFHHDVARDRDARRICGHSAIAATLEALRHHGAATGDRGGARAAFSRPRGELLKHDRWYDGASSVTFASAVFR